MMNWDPRWNRRARRHLPALMLAAAGIAACGEPEIRHPPPPAPVASAVVELTEEGGHVTQRTYVHQPVGSTVQLDGSGSYDPERGSGGSADLEFAWSFVETPTGAEPELTFPHEREDGDGWDRARPVFTAEETGTYRVALVVTDPEDGISSTEDYVTIGATVPGDLEIDLYWATPVVDLDLHLIAPGGTYWEESDCFYANPHPDWGLAGSAPDNPRLEGDDDNGGEQVSPGHERIRLTAPQEGSYTVVVVYHVDHGSKQTTIPWVQLSGANGMLDQRLDCPREMEEGEAWIAARLDIPSLDLTAEDELTTHQGLGGPEVNQ